VDANVARQAQAISPENAARIGNIVPLVGNVTFRAEAATLERARLAYLAYLQINQEFRGLIDAGDIAGALELNTGEIGAGAFNSFVQGIADERIINRAVFDEVWSQQQAAIPSSQGLYGVAAFILVILMIGAGVYQRYREL
jgi:hypothetical protein